MNIPHDKLLSFVPLFNDCCAVMDDDYVAEWLIKPNSDLNMESPLDILNSEGAERPLRLLYFIDIGEADL